MFDSLKCFCGVHDLTLKMVETPQGPFTYTYCLRCDHVAFGMFVKQGGILPSKEVRNILDQIPPQPPPQVS